MEVEIKDSPEAVALGDAFGVTLSLAEEYIVKIAVVEVPFLGLPVINQLFKYIVKKVFDKVESEGQLLIAFKMIDIEIDKQVQEYKDAINNINQGVTDEEKQKALALAKEKLRNLIRFPTK